MKETYISRESKKESDKETFIEYSKTVKPEESAAFQGSSAYTVKPDMPKIAAFNNEGNACTIMPNGIEEVLNPKAKLEELNSDTYKLVFKDGLVEFMGHKVYLNEFGALESLDIPISTWLLYKNREDWRKNNKDLFSLEKVAEAVIEQNHVTGIRIYGYKMDSLKKKISQLTELQELHLSYNALDELPEQVTELSSLTTLIIYNNGITKLPKKINKLSALQVLKIDNNILKELPASIGSLENLEELSLSLNQLTAVPAEVGKLKALKKLYLNNNKIRTLPDELAELVQLKELNLDDNKIGSAPECLSNMHCKIRINNNLLTNFSKLILENDRN